MGEIRRMRRWSESANLRAALNAGGRPHLRKGGDSGLRSEKRYGFLDVFPPSIQQRRFET
jgi:hypothetical protein